MKNETILIFGDSYSTYSGYIPTGYHAYYPDEDTSGTVNDVSKTWWHLLASETSSKILLNNSWSGSTICNTGYKGDCSKTSSFLHRLDVLIENGFFAEHSPERVFVFGGTNDSWTGNACGEVQYADWTDEDKRQILPGICAFLDKLLTVVPQQKLLFIINTELRDEVAEGILCICAHYGISTVKLSEIDKMKGHPTATGMAQIKDQVLAAIG